jgi:hypothetical protein
MLGHSGADTSRCQQNATATVRAPEDDDRFLQTAIRRCIRNAASQQRPRNQFERYVSNRLGDFRSADEAGQQRPLTSDVARLTGDLCAKIRERAS